MGEIIQFPVKASDKFGFKPVRRRRKRKDLEEHGQLNLFSGRTIKMPTMLQAFEEALILDEMDDPRAYDHYKKAVEEKDQVADAYCNLGILESGSGNTKEALECFTNSLKDDPSHFETHYNIANLYFDLSEYGPAKVHYEVAQKLDPGYSNLYFNLGLVYCLNQEFEKAVETLTEYAGLVPEKDGGKALDLVNSIKKTLAVK